MSDAEASPVRERRILGLPQSTWSAISSLGALCAFLTFVFGVFQYSANLEAGRAAQTLAMADTWRSDGYRDHYQRLAAATADQIAGISPEERALLAANATQREQAEDKIARLIMAQDPEAATSLDEVVYFFNILGLCVEARLCSETTATQFFDSTLLEFHEVFEGEIALRQSGRPNYASGLALLLDVFDAPDT